MPPSKKILNNFGSSASPVIIAHRGFSEEAPENSLAAFQKAIEVKAEMIELDVRLSSDGEFVVFPTHDALEESDLDLIVSGTREAIMMVEAGAKILPESVMAEAILFGHRALQPLIDLQLQLQEAVGKTKRIPFLEAGTGSVLDFAEKAKAGAEFVVLDVETTGTNPEMADLIEVAAVRVKKGKVADRWSTFVNPGRPIFGNQMHGITDKDVAGAPSPAEAAKQAFAFIGEATLVGHSIGFDIGFLEAALGDGTRVRPGTYLDTLTLARDGYPDLPSYTLGELSRFFGIELKQAHRALPDAEATAALLLAMAADLPGRIEALKAGIADSIRASRTSKDDAKAKLDAARRNARVSKALFGVVHKKTVRRLTLGEGIRMDGRGVDELRTITVEVDLSQDHLVQQILFSAEVVMNRREIDACLGNDMPQRSGGETVFAK